MGSRVASSEMLERPPRGLLQRLLRRGTLLAMNIFGDQGSNFHLLVRDPKQETTINVGRIVGLRLLKESPEANHRDWSFSRVCNGHCFTTEHGASEVHHM